MNKKFFLVFFTAILLLVAFVIPGTAKEQLTLASTTSTLDSGLFDVLIPPFEKKFDIQVKVIAVGTGQAIRLARDGNADVLLVHDRASEDKFVADGYGVKRLDVMHNDFVLV
ncbi:MAG: substrate-binding domain-containing protein, partial [Acidobacteria bacterium]|nr:substrate-binding domain-containing protein [Acidobacteriota bacterium]